MKVLDDPRAVRLKVGLNQSQFWGRIGTTQSAGSRYENGRKLPPPVEKLLVLAYGTDKQSSDLLSQVRRA